MCVSNVYKIITEEIKKIFKLTENILQLLDGIQFYIMFSINVIERNIVNKEGNGGILTFTQIL